MNWVQSDSAAFHITVYMYVCRPGEPTLWRFFFVNGHVSNCLRKLLEPWCWMRLFLCLSCAINVAFAICYACSNAVSGAATVSSATLGMRQIQTRCKALGTFCFPCLSVGGWGMCRRSRQGDTILRWRSSSGRHTHPLGRVRMASLACFSGPPRLCMTDVWAVDPVVFAVVG